MREMQWEATCIKFNEGEESGIIIEESLVLHMHKMMGMS